MHAPDPGPSTRQDRSNASAIDSKLGRLDAGQAVLLVSARTSVKSFLGALHAVVEDAEGRVVAGADEETSDPEGSQQTELPLEVPAGSGYTLRLNATTADSQRATCRTSVGPLSLVDGATARVQILAWDCGDRTGYVPQTAQNDCYRLADWAFVGRTVAAVGEQVEGGVAASAAATFRWSSAGPELGSFSAPEAAKTAFRCEAPGDELELEVLLSDATCRQRVTQTVSCF
jgi:hypothetical protein